ncbi:Na(+)/H(+) antiporter subunit A [Virgibacillus pantothenticus]|uniref:Cation:proton antiporter n=1 Tax=Virgibacillus pantothenticus TaxID=1473 RepID=A0A0L0QPT9_VIRPA|nr:MULTISPECIES: Na+/H+ antiporter subunit A [Virgibacillus]API90605.1 Na+/H+ antiporter subunit A [Virgibacillus sp. 6R]KNE20561.1 cation:proton antiporter [Virgibacillus pantothenticus]MBS7429721.1 Na+/H+ antiporter subunit A [Virgibacillus sp. 19R1-5]MBU8565596.1 Na+/H+ antiporter subunit A [Virgibacillus pantothenticus]MBU8599894.1 Na+/H+ antiporter subunit A [Virgibacillus pantothenticus]
MIFAVLIPLLIACFIPALSKLKEKLHTGIFVFFIPFLIFLYFVSFIGNDFTPIREQYSWIPSLGINFDLYLDGLSLLFVLLISGIGSLVVLYSIYYLSKSERLGHFYVYLLMFMSAMLGVVLSDNIFVLYTFWELTSISSFLLIGYWHFKERSRYGALKSMLITVFGGLSMLGGFILLYVVTGTTSIQQMIGQVDLILNSTYLPLILGFILLGAFTKSAQFPFHIWLPDAMEAPTPVSAYLHSATMVKAGLFLVARFSPIFSGYEGFFIVVSVFGIVTLCWGAYMSVRQTDLKAILAFSTISQLGMIMAMLGFGTKAAVFAAVFHILNHATFKGSLFMVAGIVDHETGTRDIRKLGGLATLMPITATLAIFGTFSMAGVPFPFLNGYYSKELFFGSTLGLGSDFWSQAIPYLAVLGSIFTFVYSMYLFFGTFTGKKQFDQLPKKPHEAPIGMLISPMILVVGVVIFGLFPNIVNASFLQHAATAINSTVVYKEITFWHGFITPFKMSLAVVGFGTVLFLTRKKWQPVYQVLPGKVSFNHVYDAIVNKIGNVANRITNYYMTGSLKTYMSLILGTTLIVSLLFMYLTNGFAFNTDQLAEVSFIEVAVVLIMIVAAIATIYMNHNVAAILVVGVVGFGVAILFVIYRAPDIALTQLVIETITVALFLLCFYHLPKLRKSTDSAKTKIMNATISIGFGALVTLVAISAHSSRWFESIADYFVENSKKLGGGDNIVNVILVDFRGLDTLFEISVLGIAALAIVGLIKYRKNKEAE